jgi:hypothetical protein
MGIQKVTQWDEGSSTPASIFKNVIELGVNKFDFAFGLLLARAFDHRKFVSFGVNF